LNKTELIELSYLLVDKEQVRKYMDEDWFSDEACYVEDKGWFIPSKYLVHTFNKKDYMFPGPINL
jgi:hypothetical protein